MATGFLAAYADDTEALAAGLVQGQQYVDPSGFVRQVL